MNKIDGKLLDYAKDQIYMNMERFAPHMDSQQLVESTNELMSFIDWNNPALMHKGFGWITKEYLNKRQNVAICN